MQNKFNNKFYIFELQIFIVFLSTNFFVIYLKRGIINEKEEVVKILA